MGNETSTMTHVFRQRSSLVLAAVCAVIGLVLLGSVAQSWAHYPRPLFAAWVVFVLALAWTVFVRPCVRIDIGGVTLRNVVRDVSIPWDQLTHTSARWNLKVFAGDQGYTAWAISSERQRPRAVSGRIFRMPVPGRLQGVAEADLTPPTTAAKVTAQSVARTITMAKQDYDEAVAEEELSASPQAVVQVTWVPLVMVVLLLPAIFVVVLTLG